MDSLVSKIRKSASSEIWVSLRMYNGKQYVDVREHFLSGDDRHWHPTKKGLMIDPELLSQVIDGIEQLGTDLGTVATIAKSSEYEIRIGVQEFQRHQYGEVRTYYRDGASNEMKPSPKGFTFRPSMKEAILESLQGAEDQLHQPQR